MRPHALVHVLPCGVSTLELSSVPQSATLLTQHYRMGQSAWPPVMETSGVCCQPASSSLRAQREPELPSRLYGNAPSDGEYWPSSHRPGRYGGVIKELKFSVPSPGLQEKQAHLQVENTEISVQKPETSPRGHDVWEGPSPATRHNEGLALLLDPEG